MIARARTPGLTWIPLPSSGMDLVGADRRPPLPQPQTWSRPLEYTRPQKTSGAAFSNRQRAAGRTAGGR